MKRLLITLLLLFSTAYSEEEVFYRAAGPILPISANTQPKGTLSFQPFLYFINVKEQSERFPGISSFITQVFLQYGILDFMDFRTSIQTSYATRQNKKAYELMDSMAGFSFQLYKIPNSTSIRLMIYEIFPTGKYQRLTPDKVYVQGIGEGSFQTGIMLMVSQQFHKRFVMYGNLVYFAYTKVHVNGFNFYGGGFGTNGIVNPGDVMEGIISGELSISKRVALTCDFMYFYKLPTGFKGNSGITEDGQKASCTMPYKFQISMCPAVEYSFSDNIGLCGGAWFSLYNRNVFDFMSGVVTLYCLF
jgi:hypothetical protein